ncbi:hypothetical protein Msp_0951 [Methanosphaera stadtmanae DSM 3091]|uniref:Uncharacterized protein n=1 Tax=Methanosphaera stadtmanae (strain ATCC 43021 / DSM 3091 / JCM 11832 / MCB-3) TaxID=339860 RepID=Q2NFR4_METST|nr:hypothetical protein Msp_0951 [Methanosphaera stadtmanae DSM 3091]
MLKRSSFFISQLFQFHYDLILLRYVQKLDKAEDVFQFHYDLILFMRR